MRLTRLIKSSKWPWITMMHPWTQRISSKCWNRCSPNTQCYVNEWHSMKGIVCRLITIRCHLRLSTWLSPSRNLKKSWYSALRLVKISWSVKSRNWNDWGENMCLILKVSLRLKACKLNRVANWNRYSNDRALMTMVWLVCLSWTRYRRPWNSLMNEIEIICSWWAVTKNHSLLLT